MKHVFQSGQYGRFQPKNSGRDPYWNNVQLLLNGSVSVTTDSSSYARALGATGVTLSSTQQLFGVNTYKVTNAGDYLSGTASDSWWGTAVGAGEWCDERWVYTTSVVGTGQYCGYSHTSLFNDKNAVADRASAVADSLDAGSYSAAGGTALTLNTWHHLAFVRDNTSDASWGYCHIYVDGTKVASTASFAKTAVYASTAGFGDFIGWLNNATACIGYQTQVRLTSGTSRYYANFTPPTAAFPTS
jgi:hypothetical protein